MKIALLALTITFIGCEKKNTFITDVKSASTETELASIVPTDGIKVNQERTIAFITGIDTGSSTFYKDAKDYFVVQNSEIVETAYSLQEIILWLNINHNGKSYNDIHIVNKSKMSKLSLETTINGPEASASILRDSLLSAKLPKLKKVLTADTKLIFHGSGIGNNVELLDAVKKVFTSDIEPTIIASTNVSVFGGKFNTHYLAKPYYGFYPTANSPGRVDLSKEFSKNYPDAEINWLAVMNNTSERFQGDVYSYKFNVPVKWEIAYDTIGEIPEFSTMKELHEWMKENEIISTELKELNIPIEKFRLYQTVKGNKLIIKGKVTVICVLEPVMSKAYPSNYMIPEVDNLRLYDTL